MGIINCNLNKDSEILMRYLIIQEISKKIIHAGYLCCMDIACAKLMGKRSIEKPQRGKWNYLIFH